MRKTKFRGKRLDNGEWISGNLVGTSRQAVIVRLEEDKDGNAIDEETQEVDPATVGEYVGLNDKKSVEIFEGDILQLKIDDEEILLREVWFGDGYFCVQGEAEDELHDISFAVEAWEAVIIGNIYDTPQLLKQ